MPLVYAHQIFSVWYEYVHMHLLHADYVFGYSDT